MDVETWFRRWLSRHPLKAPPTADQQQYTTEVMARIKTLEQPVPKPIVLRPRWVWPRLALVASTVAIVALVVGRAEQTPEQPQVVQQVEYDTQLPAALDEAIVLESSDGAIEQLAQELESYDTLLLAQSGGNDAGWLEQTLELLDQLDEDIPEDATGDSSDEDWLRELEFLDDSDLAASS